MISSLVAGTDFGTVLIWAVATGAMIGAWNGAAYLFADSIRTFRDVPDEQAQEYLSEKSVWFRAMLVWITFPPMILYAFGEPVALVIVYASLGALFLPFLAITLMLLLNSRRVAPEYLAADLRDTFRRGRRAGGARRPGWLGEVVCGATRGASGYSSAPSSIIRATRDNFVVRARLGSSEAAGSLKRAYTVLVALGSIVWFALGIEWFRGIRGIPLLMEVGSTDNLERYPFLSVIVPARNEEKAIKESAETMLNQSYPGDLEVIAVDDRSTDGTGRILESLQREYPDRLKVLRIQDLPEGWLGKNHALYVGAKSAQGEWLLFTDADIRFSPDCFEYAINYASRRGLHHLTLPPEIHSRGLLLRGFVAAFTLIFTVTQRPWRARDPRSTQAVGVGSFNLVSRDVYESIGTHRAIAMRPDDDMKLAKLVKKHGFRQDVAYGNGLVSVEWHESLKGAVSGLGKSMFPGMDYRVDAAILASTLLFITNVLPFLSVVFSRGPARLLSAPSVLLTCAMYLFHARHTKSRTTLWYAALHPFSVCVLLYAMFNSVVTTLANDGIKWRGTHYPLAHLKRNAV